MPPEVHVLAAIEQGVKVYGFSSHCPVPFKNPWSIKDEKLGDYLAEIEELKTKYRGQIEIYKSLEIDFIPGKMSLESQLVKDSNLDYTLGSVHFAGIFEDGTLWEIDSTTQKFKRGVEEIFHGNIRQAVAQYYGAIREMAATACPDVVGHLDKIKIHNAVAPFFSEAEDWYKNEALKTLEVIKSAGAIVEVNTRGIYKKLVDEPYPGRMILKEIQKMGIPVCLNSDSHHPTEITREFGKMAALLKALGFRKMRILYGEEWIDVDFDERGLKF